MRIDVLGPIRVTRDGAVVDLGTPKQRRVLAALALDPGRPVDVDRLVELVWGDRAPSAARTSVQAYIAGLRKILEPDRAQRGGADVIVTSVHGYLLQIPPEHVDASAFAAAVDRSAAVLAGAPSFRHGVPVGLEPDELRAVVVNLDEALASWRGTPFVDLGEQPELEPTIARLTGRRTTAILDRARARLALGDTARAANELAELVAEHPLDEHAALMLVLALARSGRQSDALRAIRRLRATLRDELGIDPDPAIDELRVAVLRQDPDVVGIGRTPARTTAPPTIQERDRQERDRQQPDIQETAAIRRPGDVMVGRDGELRTLTQLITAARRHDPQFALLIGEAGIGKSRLLRAFASQAAEDRTGGHAPVVLFGRCSADQGAPALWPWVSILRSLTVGDADAIADLLARLEGRSGPDAADDPDAARFQLWDEVRQLLVETARQRPTVVILDDLHWADEATLRLLQHVVHDVEGAGLVVTVSTRPLPDATDALAAVVEAIARRGGARLNLAGLDVEAVAELVGDTATGDHTAAELHDRTEGNPFYVVELARHLGDVADTTPGTAMPASVRDVVRRRVGALPTATQTALDVAAVIGRTAPIDVLASALGIGDDEALLGCLQPALDARLVYDEADNVRFAHAIVRDAVYDDITTRRRAQLHADVAASLQSLRPVGDPSDRAELAWQLLRAGRPMAPAAWRAAVAAAVDARSVHAYGEAARLLVAAAEAQAADERVTAVERFAVLQAQGEAFRDNADLESMRRALDAAIALASSVGDHEAVVMAADAGTSTFLWFATPHGEVLDAVVGPLRHALSQLDPSAVELRCRGMLALAVELYWAPTVDESDELVEQGLALAREIDDPQLLLTVLHQAALASWRRDRSDFRWALADELLGVANAYGSADAIIGAHTLRASVAQEIGMIDLMFADMAAVRRLSSGRRTTLPLFVVATMEFPWLVMSGAFAEADRSMLDLVGLMERSAIPQADAGLHAAAAVSAFWRGGAEQLIEPMMNARDDMRLSDVLTVLLVRAGRIDLAETVVDEIDLDDVPDRYDFTFQLGLAAEAAAFLGRARMGAEAYARLLKCAGRPAVAGVAVCIGPVDMYLAFAAFAMGDVVLATRHADDAGSLCTKWGIGVVGDWFGERRRQLGF